MPDRIMADLIPLIHGNIKCIKETKSNGKPLD